MRFLCLSFVLVISFSIAKADPVLIQVNQGNVTVNSGRVWSFNFSGPGGSITAVSAGFLPSSTIPSLTRFAGQTVSFNVFSNPMFWQDWGGVVTVGNESHNIGDHSTFVNGVYGQFSFNTAPVVLPFITDSMLTLVVPFTGGGHTTLAGYNLFSANWNGSGFATVLLNQNNNSYSFRTVTYSFTNVPEPASMILLASGLLGIALRHRTRRTR